MAGINIDSFLEGITGEKQKQLEQKKDTPEDKIDLSFEEDVKQKILALQKTVGEKDFNFLVKAYEEMKSFDESLPNKLFSINNYSGKALSEFSSKYSSQYLSGVRTNMETLKGSITEHLKNINRDLDSNNFQLVMSNFTDAMNSYRLFPKEFVLEKTQLGKELRGVEVRINERFLVYKRDEVKKIKLKINESLKALRDSMLPGNIFQIEEKLNTLISIMDKTPNVFYSDLILERTQVSKSIVGAEEFLAREYEREFAEKKKEIFVLLDKFQKYKTSGDVSNALITYDEMIILFGKMPDIFLEEKINLFDRVNKVFDSLNNLLMSSNMSVFVKTYEFGKTIDEVRDYVDHVNLTQRADLNILLDLKKRIGQIPLSFKPEVLEMVTTLDRLILNFQKRSVGSQPPQRNESSPSPMQERKINLEPSTPEPKKEVNRELVTVTNSNDSVKSNVAIEINDCFKKLLDSENRNEAARYGRKVDFYLDMLKVSDSNKKQIRDRVKAAINEKEES